MSGHLTTKKTNHLKGRILAKFADIEINGRNKPGLLSKALNRIEELLEDNRVDMYDRGLDKLLKLLPYVMPKIGYDKPLMASNGSEAESGSFQQVNIYLNERLNNLNDLKNLNSGVDTGNVSRETKPTSQTTQAETADYTEVKDETEVDDVSQDKSST